MFWFIENGECTFSHNPLIHINQMENWCSFTIYHNMAPHTIVGFSGTNICLPTIPTSLSRYRYSSYETRLLLTFEVRTLCGLIMLCQAMAVPTGFEPITTQSKCVVLPLHYGTMYIHVHLLIEMHKVNGLCQLSFIILLDIPKWIRIHLKRTGHTTENRTPITRMKILCPNR